MTPLESRKQEIERIVLSEEEREKAILEAKVRKWFEERHREYWRELEEKRPKQAGKGVAKIV